MASRKPVVKAVAKSVTTGMPMDLLVSVKTPLDTDSGLKYDSDKPDMSLLSPIAMYELAKVLSFGKKKYAAHNWRKGIARSRLVGAALRHIFLYLGGEDTDSETGLSHMAHAMCCCMFAVELELVMPLTDDRHVAKVVTP